MKAKTGKLFALLMAFVIVLGVAPLTALADAEELYYGRGKLASMDGGANLVAAYDAMYAGVAAKETAIDLSEYKLSIDDMQMVYELYRNDHSEHYWLPNGYSYLPNGSTVTQIVFSYLTGFNTAEFEMAAAELLTAAEGKTTDYDKALVLHDALVKHIEYDASSANAYNAYGAIVDKKAVCEGYAEAYQYLLQCVGIQSYIVTGTGNGVEHEWNLVRLDDEYYYTDVTWDDPTGLNEYSKPVFYAYFNISTSLLQEDHVIDDKYGILPYCANSLLYKDYTVLSSYTVDNVAATFKKADNQRIARIYYNGTQTDEFDNWWKANYIAVANSVGAYGTLSTVSVGREHYIVITVASESATISGNIKSLGKEGDITVLLIKSGETEPAYKTVVSGTDSTAYSIADIARGTYTVRVMKADHITYEGTVTADTAAVKYDMELKHPGDVTGGGELDAGDLTEFTKALILNEASVSFDVNGNGKIDIVDLVRLKRYIAEI